MAEEADLSTWLARVTRCRARKEVFALLDQFRKQTWTDEECSQMGKHYIRLVSNMADESDQDLALKGALSAGNNEESDGPVWYEKM